MKKYIKYLLTLIICLSISITTINAKSYIKDLFQAGENISIDNELDGTAFIAGETIEINNKINGITFVAGSELDINSKQEYIFGAGATINIKSDVEKDLFLAGETINIKENSNVLRDAYLVANSVNIEGNIERNIYISANTVDLKGNFNGNVIVSATQINIDDNVKISGTLKYNENATINKINDKIQTKTYKAETDEITFTDYITNFISTYIHITLLGIVLVFVCEGLFKNSLKQTEKGAKDVVSLCGKGFLILIGVPIIALMLLFSGAFISIGVVGATIYAILIYCSHIFTAYFIANLLDKKYFKKNMNSYLLIIIGLFIIYVVKLIPVIGGLVSFISLLLGLGILGNMIIELKK